MGSSAARECKRIREVQTDRREEDLDARGMKEIIGVTTTDVCKRRKLSDFSPLPSEHTTTIRFTPPPPPFQLCLTANATYADLEVSFSVSPTDERWIVCDGEFSGETRALSEGCGDSGLMDSSSSAAVRSSSKNHQQAIVSSPGKMPSAAEIEEFFSAAEKYDQKRFAEKYNYDVVRDVPLEGRYQWVRLKP